MVACTSKKNSYTQEQLYEQTSSGVVLIQNTFIIKSHYQIMDSIQPTTSSLNYKMGNLKTYLIPYPIILMK